MLSTILIDDEILVLKAMQKCLLKMKDLHLVQTFTDAAEAIAYMKDNPVDIVFCDIEMDSLTGLEAAKHIKNLCDYFVLVTAYGDRYLKEGHEVHADGYLYKPLSTDKVKKEIEELRRRNKRIGKAENNVMTIQDGSSVYLLQLDQLIMVKAAKEYQVMHLAGLRADIVIRKGLHILEKELCARKQFKRVHKSYIVNLAYVEGLKRQTLIVAGKEVPVSKSYLGTLKRALNEFLD
jgi:DNA-binding LytR/AlgR family response regulator